MDQIKRQADADAIRHAAKLIEAVSIFAETDDGKAVAVALCRDCGHLVRWLHEQANGIESEQS